MQHSSSVFMLLLPVTAAAAALSPSTANIGPSWCHAPQPRRAVPVLRRATSPLLLSADNDDGEEADSALPSFWDKIRYGQKGKTSPPPSSPPPPPPGPPPSRYIPPEEMESNDEQIQRELRWEAKVQRESQKGGNQLRQNDILRDEVGKG